MRASARTLLFASVAVILSTLFALLLVEVLLRLTAPPRPAPDREIRMPDTELGYRLIPGSPISHGFMVDANGFNNETVPERADIVALGDSMTFGENGSVTENWPQDLGRLMNASVYNMGVGGYGPVQYYALTDTALSFRPKYLIVGLLLGNDFFDAYNMVYNGHLLDRADYEYHGVPFLTDHWKEFRDPAFRNDVAQSATEFNQRQNVPLESLREWIRARSALYDFLANRTYLFREALGLSKPFWLGTTDWKQDDPDVTLRWEGPPGPPTVFWEGRTKLGLDVTGKNIIEGMRLTKELLRKMKAKADVAGAEFVLIVMADKALAYAPLLGDKVKDNKDFVENLANEETLRKDMLAFCAEEGITCVDLLPSLTVALQEGKELYPRNWDGHPVPLGYQVFAEAVFAAIHRE